MNGAALQKGTSVEDNGLMHREESSSELQTTAASAEKQHEIQSAIVLARKFPRDEDAAFAKLMKAAQRTSFAEVAEYSFPRGKVKDEKGNWVQNYVKGPSVNVAREAARVWGNIRYGLDVLTDDSETRGIRGWAWDLETNVKVHADDNFAKVVFKKGWNNAPDQWVPTDERELRELTNRRGAILVRNCILQLLPKDIVEDALIQCHDTLTDRAKKDPEGEKKRIIMAFSELSVTPEMLAGYLGHPLAQSSPTQIADLRGIYKSIKDGHSTWAEYVSPTNGKTEEPAGPELISEEQRTALVNIAQESGSIEKLGLIVNGFGFEMLANITVDRYDEVAAAIKAGGIKVEDKAPEAAAETKETEPAKSTEAETKESETPPATETTNDDPPVAEKNTESLLEDLRLAVKEKYDEANKKPASKKKANEFLGSRMLKDLDETAMKEFLALEF